MEFRNYFAPYSYINFKHAKLHLNQNIPAETNIDNSESPLNLPLISWKKMQFFYNSITRIIAKFIYVGNLSVIKLDVSINKCKP